jgi:hypothetical protein
MHSWETVIVNTILPDLDKGRPDFDKPHTLAVVHWVKYIIENESNLHFKILVTAAYAHDWGYIGLFEDGVTDMKDIHAKKERHMEVGANKIETLLQEQFSNLYSPEEILRIKHLVYVHDRVENLNEDDEIALMEADTLGALDSAMVQPTFSKHDNDVYIEREVKGRRFPHFKHKSAINVFDELLSKRINFYNT